MSELFDGIMKGLNEAVDFENGKKNGTKIHRSSIKEVETFSPSEIREIRLKSKMTQSSFATCIGVSNKAVEAWEGGKGKPNGAARRTLGLMKENPNFASDMGIIASFATKV